MILQTYFILAMAIAIPLPIPAPIPMKEKEEGVRVRRHISVKARRFPLSCFLV